MDTDRVKHLEFLQAVIARQAGNSFLIKGWTVIVVSALFALAAKDANQYYLLVALFPAVLFWGLDAFYLRQERLYRKLYDAVWKEINGVPTYSFDTSPVAHTVTGWFATLFARTVLFFHLPIIAVVVAVTVFSATT